LHPNCSSSRSFVYKNVLGQSNYECGGAKPEALVCELGKGAEENAASALQNGLFSIFKDSSET
jgi:hypothetical protein